MLKAEPTFYARTASKRPYPSQRVVTAHALTDVGPDADIPWKLLSFDPYLDAIRSVEAAACDSRAPEYGVMALDFPAFDCGHV